MALDVNHTNKFKLYTLTMNMSFRRKHIAITLFSNVMCPYVSSEIITNCHNYDELSLKNSVNDHFQHKQKGKSYFLILNNFDPAHRSTESINVIPLAVWHLRTWMYILPLIKRDSIIVELLSLIYRALQTKLK